MDLLVEIKLAGARGGFQFHGLKRHDAQHFVECSGADADLFHRVFLHELHAVGPSHDSDRVHAQVLANSIAHGLVDYE